MTGLSLREQLLQAGLVSEKQVKQAEQSQKRQTFTDRKQVGKKDRNFREEQRSGRAAEAGGGQGREGRRTQPQARGKGGGQGALGGDPPARRAEQDREARERRLLQLRASTARWAASRWMPSLRERIVRGEIAIVRCDGHYELVPAETGERVREREPRAVVNTSDKVESTPVDDAYKDFVVPDDLVW